MAIRVYGGEPLMGPLNGLFTPIVDTQHLLDLPNLPFFGDSSKKCFYVRNIPANWDDWQLFFVFRQFGLVNSVVLPEPKSRNETNFRYGFVEMLSLAGAAAVLKRLSSNGSIYIQELPHPLQVQLAAAKSKVLLLRELQSDAVHNIKLKRRSKEFVCTVGGEANEVCSEKRYLQYTRSEMLKIQETVKENNRVPSLAVKEILKNS